jgi:hypothetical protein
VPAVLSEWDVSDHQRLSHARRSSLACLEREAIGPLIFSARVCGGAGGPGGAVAQPKPGGEPVSSMLRLRR